MSQVTTEEAARPGAGPARPRGGRLRGRPDLYTDYADDQAMLNTPAKRLWTGLLLLGLLIFPWFVSRDLNSLLTLVFVYAIGAIGLNLVTGYAGQVSLGHAFFLGLGAYTAAFFGAETAGLRGLGLPMVVWLPMAGVIPALVGLAVAPLASRVRGLYLAIVTLGLVFVGEHLFRELRSFTGGPGTGRAAARPELFGFRLDRGGDIFGIEVAGHVRFYLFSLLILIVMAVVAKNLARSKVGRAFAAVRDRDIAAEIMGVPLMRTKVIAFTISSFYAGICGALLAIAVGGHISTEFYNLLLSVEFLAMILIGGVATISGSLMGAAFVVLLPRLVQNFAHYVPFIAGREGGAGLLTVFQLETILFGSLIVAFLILEPRGLYGLWLRVRNYWKAWPFSY